MIPLSLIRRAGFRPKLTFAQMVWRDILYLILPLSIIVIAIGAIIIAYS